MILGVGIDLVTVSDFRAQLDDPASTLRQGTFTPRELEDTRHRPSHDQALHLASRFAAKEAFIKAWSAGAFGRPPVLPRVDLREIEVTTDHFGRPALRLHGAVAQAVATLGKTRIHLSLTHEVAICAAVAVLEATT